MCKFLQIMKDIIRIALIQDRVKLMESHLTGLSDEEQYEKKEKYPTAFFSVINLKL